MPAAARVGDMHTCPMVDPGPKPHVGGPILPPGEPTVLIGYMPAARVGDKATCVGPPDSIAKGSATVKIGNMAAARMGDSTAHGGVITVGCPTVKIGDSGSGSAGGGGGGSEEEAGTGSVAGAEATDASAQIGALQAAAAAGMAFVQQCVKQSAPPPPKPALKPGEKNKPTPPSGTGKGKPAATPAGGASGATAGEEGAPPPQGSTPAGGPKTAWIGFSLLDKREQPLAKEPYEIVLPNGEVRKDKLDSKGEAKFDGIDPGTCLISFPKLDELRRITRKKT